MELSKNKIKYFSSFSQKKTREQEGKFIVEGNKLVEELLVSSYQIDSIVGTIDWHKNHTISCDFYEATHDEIKKISLLQNPQEVWALVHNQSNQSQINLEGLCLALDDIQDPGNLGTIIRLADWFGVSEIICSKGCVDAYNPKVVQATMGSIFRTHIHYVDLPHFLAQHKYIDIFAADMFGENVYTTDLPKNAIVVMGNEGNGISNAVSKIANRNLHIPTFNTSGKTSESLNVAVATAILCSEFKRRTL